MSVSGQLQKRVEVGLKDTVSASVRQRVNRAGGPRVAAISARLDSSGSGLRSVKKYEVQNLALLLDQAVANLATNGITVYSRTDWPVA
ncbi:MAG TPA: hypothetical protein VMW83_04820 [Spirochaetia bacterium]|nr:hypothetical protein [Spirochaetia bacterium]